MQVRGKNLKFMRAWHAFCNFEKNHRQRIGFLPRRTAKHPHAHRIIAALFQQFRKYLPFQNFKGFGISEKICDTDQDIRIKRIELFVIIAQSALIFCKLGEPVQHHAPGDAALYGGGLVERKIDAAMLVQQVQNSLEGIVTGFGATRRFTLHLGRHGWRGTMPA